MTFARIGPFGLTRKMGLRLCLAEFRVLTVDAGSTSIKEKIMKKVLLGLALTTLALSPNFALGAASEQGCISSGGQANGCTVNSVPVSGSTFMLFGAGFVALALWHHRRRAGSAA